MQQIKTAVIMAGGNGTRRMPITRVVDKVMLPIGNRPTIDYVIEQCAQAGINRIICTVSDPDTLIKKYYGDTIDITTEYPWLELTGSIEIKYVTQDTDIHGYGSASALACTKDAFDDELFVVVGGDGFIYGSRQPIISTLINDYASRDNAAGVITGLEIPDSDIGYTSMVKHSEDYRLTDLIEKPTITPSGKKLLANFSYYIVSRKIFPILRKLKPAPNGEYFLTDAILELSKIGNGVTVLPIDGEYLDSGREAEWLHANQVIIKKSINK